MKIKMRYDNTYQTPNARKFKRWVTNEVLPAIRKHGVYAVDELLENPDMLIVALTELKAEREHRKLLEHTEAVQNQQIFEMNIQWLVEESGLPFDFDMAVIDELSSFKNHSHHIRCDIEHDSRLLSVGGAAVNLGSFLSCCCSALRGEYSRQSRNCCIPQGRYEHTNR